MSPPKGKRPRLKTDLAALIVFWTSSALFAINILIGKASMLWGWETFKFGNTGEFLLLLIASISVVVASLHREASENDFRSIDRDQSNKA